MAQKPTSKPKPTSSKPAFNVYAVVPDGDKTIIGSKLGVAFNHNSSKGLSIYLEAHPIAYQGKIRLVAYPTREING